jgi:hypothetical protein
MYFHQIRLVLQIAATYGRDPTDPVRAADFLVIRGRHPTVEQAVAALVAAPQPRPAKGRSSRRGLFSFVKQVPTVLGLRLQGLRGGNYKSILVGVAEAAAMVLPFIGVPIWAVLSARSTRSLAQQAISYYDTAPPNSIHTPIPLAPETATRTRWIRAGILLCLAIGLGFAAQIIPPSLRAAIRITST